MPEKSSNIWKLSTANGARGIDLPDISSLDAITRQVPQGYYSTFRTFDGGKRVLGLQAHLQRLYKPATTQRIKPSVQEDKLRQYLVELLDNIRGEAKVRVILTKAGQVYVVLEPLKPLAPEIYSNGVKVVTTDVQRENPRIKSTLFISASKSARAEISRSDNFEALLVRNDSILEGITSNFFYVRDGVLGTAQKEILLGVTRRTVLHIARGSGLGVVYRPLKRKQVSALSEAFLTSSSRGIVPIVQIDVMTVGEGVPGPVTKKLMDGYQTYVMRHAELINKSPEI
ncbi:MAG: aminotransferase class IV [Anaerolineales bacterium]